MVDGLGDLKADLGDVLGQLRALRTAQSSTDAAIAALQAVVGVDGGIAPERTLLQAVASIQSAIDVLLARSALRPPTSDASVQACIPRGPSFLDLGMSVPWTSDRTTSTAALGRFSNDFAQFPRNPRSGQSSAASASQAPRGDGDHQACTLTALDTRLPTRPPSSASAYPRSSADSIILIPASFSSPNASSDIAPPSSPRISTRNMQPETPSRAIDSQMTSFQTGLHATSSLSPLSSLSSAPSASQCSEQPKATSQMAPSSPLSSLSSVRDTPMSPRTRVDDSCRQHVDLGPDDSRAVGDDAISAPKTTRLPRIETELDDGDLPSCLPTPPSDTAGDRESRPVSRTMREDCAVANAKSMTHTHNPLVIPPSPGRDLSIGEVPRTSTAMGRPSFAALAEGSVPLTPPLRSPLSSVGSSFSEQVGGNEQGTVHMITEEKSDDEDVAVPNLATLTIAPTNESQSAVQTSQATMDVDLSKTPRQSASHASVDPAYSPLRAYGSGYDFHFTSPPRPDSPPTSYVRSRCATPSSSAPSSTQPQDEDEVWHALIPGTSSVSTPLPSTPSLPMMFSRDASVHPAHHDTAPLAVDPSLLQLRRPLLVASASRTLEGSLSPLTSVGGSEGDKNEGGAAYAPPRSSSHTPVPGGRATSGPEAAGTDRRAGGPGASLEELVALARRGVGSKIRFKMPGGTRGEKRKRSVDEDGDGEGGEHDGADASGDTNMAELIEERDVDRRVGGGNEARTQEGPAVREDADVPPARTGTGAPILGTRTKTPPISPLALGPSISTGLVGNKKAMTSDLPASKKAPKKEGERRRKKQKRVLTSSRATVTYHVRNGQIVALAAEPAPQSRAPATQSVPLPANTDQDALAPDQVSDPNRRDNHAVKTPPSSAANPTKSSRGPRVSLKLSPKEEVRKPASKRPAGWPELPAAFSQWDAQFIQCDDCDEWYHYGCVAIEAGDPRLEPAALFTCPPCCKGGATRQTSENKGSTCVRPDCPEPQVTAESELYFVEKLVGRKKVQGYVYVWLAKWEGYPMTQASWIPKENVVGGDSKLFDAFLKDATREGADLSQEVVLLQEAVDAGWKE